MTIDEELLALAAGPAPPEALERASDLLLDHLAVAGRGARTAAASTARRALAGGAGPSAVIGTGHRLPPVDAAFLNGISGHSVELDDTHEPASLHPGTCVWPAVLALADANGVGWDRALPAAVAGYDVMCAVGERLGAQRAYARGLHPTAVCGPLGAAVAGARLLGLGEDAIAAALGIAASMAGGLMTFLNDGAWTKPMHAGHAAASGVRAAQLAAAGFAGPAGAIGGDPGFLRAFGGDPPNAAGVRRPGDGVLQTSVKLYPCCRYIHGCLDLLVELARVEPTLAEAERVECAVLSAGWDLVAAPRERKLSVAGTVDAQFSLPFAAAVAITAGEVTLDDFETAPARAQALRPLMERIDCVRDAELDALYPEAWGAAVRVRLPGGRTLRSAQRHIDGSPARPAGRERIEAKAAALLGVAEAGRMMSLVPASDI